MGKVRVRYRADNRSMGNYLFSNSLHRPISAIAHQVAAMAAATAPRDTGEYAGLFGVSKKAVMVMDGGHKNPRYAAVVYNRSGHALFVEDRSAHLFRTALKFGQSRRAR